MPRSVQESPDRVKCPLSREECLMCECALFARVNGKGWVCGFTGRGRLRVLKVDTAALNNLDRFTMQGGGTLYVS